MSFTVSDKTKILRLKSAIASYYALQMKKIGDKQLESYFFDTCIISGGCIASLFHDEPVNDIDIYAKDKTSMQMIKDHILLKGKNIKSFTQYEIDPDGNKVIKNVDNSRPAITDNAVTLTNDVQFIYIDAWPEAQTKFDFIHCMPYYDIGTQRLYISEAQYDAIKSKTLVANGNIKPNEKRTNKYVKRGWGVKLSLPVQIQHGVIAQEITKLSPETMYINTPT